MRQEKIHAEFQNILKRLEVESTIYEQFRQITQELKPVSIEEGYKLGYLKKVLTYTLSSLKNSNEEEIFLSLELVKIWIDELAATSKNPKERRKNWFKSDRGDLHGKVFDNFSGELAAKIYDFLNLSSEEWRDYKNEKIEEKKHTPELDLPYEKYLETTESLLKSPSWRENYAGLVACLGRRPTELLDNNAFSLIETEDGYELYFNNQLKKKGGEVESYQIPTLFNNAEEIYHVWLNFINHHEVQSKLTAIDEFLSEDISAEVQVVKRNELRKEKFNFIVNQVVKEHFDFLPTPNNVEVSCRILRRCYATIAVSMNQDITASRTCENYFKYLLGHSDDELGVTIGYKDYKLIPNLCGKIVELEVSPLESELGNFCNMITLERIKKASREQNVDVDSLLNLLLDKYETEEDYLQIHQNLEEIKGDQKPFSAKQKIVLAFRKIINHNDNPLTHPNNRYAITVRALQDLTGSRHSAIKLFLDEYQDEIELHHSKYGLHQYSNKGKINITEVIQ